MITGPSSKFYGTRDNLDIRSYIDTARKHGHNAMAVLRAATTGIPWHPPAPAPT